MDCVREDIDEPCSCSHSHLPGEDCFISVEASVILWQLCSKYCTYPGWYEAVAYIFWKYAELKCVIDTNQKLSKG